MRMHLLSLALCLLSVVGNGQVQSQNVVGYSVADGEANIVGYTRLDKRQGEFVSNFRPIGGEDFTLGMMLSKELKPDVELSFYDGRQWVEALTADANDGKVHWFRKDTMECADDLVIKRGVAVRYRLPPDVDSIVFAGEVVFEDEEGSRFTQEDIEMLKRLHDAVEKLKLDLPPIKPPKTEPPKVSEVQVKEPVATNVVERKAYPTKFRFFCAEKGWQRVFLDYGLFRVCDRVSGWPIDLSSLSDVQFAVDPDLAEDDPDRMDAKAVEQLFTLIFPRSHVHSGTKTVGKPPAAPKRSFWEKSCVEYLGGFYNREDLFGSFLQKLVYWLIFGGGGLWLLFKVIVKLFKQMCGYDEREKSRKKRKRK